jgi:hypothetical protein
VQIQPELILVMPLQLRLLAVGDANYGVMKFSEDESGEDMFSRTGPDDDFNNYLKQLTRVTLKMDYENTLGLDQASIYMVSRDDEGGENWSKSVTLEEGAGKSLSLEIEANELLVYPFRPGLEVRVPVGNPEAPLGSRYGLIEIKRGTEDAGAGLKAKISLDLEAHVDMEIDL